MVSDTRALNAVVEAMLITQIKAVNVVQSKMEFMGSAERSVTYMLYSVVMSQLYDSTHIVDSVGKGRATVTRQSPSESGRRSQETEAGGHDKDDQDSSHD